MTPIYLDYNATTPIDPEVVEAMLPYLHTHFGNPSSTHAFGQTARLAIERAREQVADLLGAEPKQIVFTSGGTEASNQAIKGPVVAKMLSGSMSWLSEAHIVTSVIEHPATLQPCAFLERLGCKVSRVGVDRLGLIDVDAVKKACADGATLVSVMHANNEVGTLQPISAISKIAKECGALVHTDAAQSLGKVRVDVNELGVDLLTVAGHKLYAPKGIGALYIRDGVRLESFIHGAGHEEGRRAGTENVPFIVALGKACAIAQQNLSRATERLTRLRDRLWKRLRSGLGDQVSLNGHPDLRLPNTLNVNLVGTVGADVLLALPEIAASTGSACHEGEAMPSPVLTAMGVPPALGQSAVRLSVGRFTTEDEIDLAAAELIRVAHSTRFISTAAKW